MKTKIPRPESIGEAILARQLTEHGIHFVREYKFHPERRWKFDFALLECNLAVEVEGGVWSRGRHITPKGFIADCEKYNSAAMYGWYVMRFPTEQVESGEAIMFVSNFYKIAKLEKSL